MTDQLDLFGNTANPPEDAGRIELQAWFFARRNDPQTSHVAAAMLNFRMSQRHWIALRWLVDRTDDPASQVRYSELTGAIAQVTHGVTVSNEQARRLFRTMRENYSYIDILLKDNGTEATITNPTNRPAGIIVPTALGRGALADYELSNGPVTVPPPSATIKVSKKALAEAIGYCISAGDDELRLARLTELATVINNTEASLT